MHGGNNQNFAVNCNFNYVILIGELDLKNLCDNRFGGERERGQRVFKTKYQKFGVKVSNPDSRVRSRSVTFPPGWSRYMAPDESCNCYSLLGSRGVVAEMGLVVWLQGAGVTES